MLLKKELNHLHNLEGFFPVIYNDSKKEILSLLKLKKIMVNVAYLNTSQKKRDIHDTMDFKGQVFLDSGVFQRGFYKKEFTEDEIKDYRDKLLEWYSSLKPNYASSFDLPIPFPPTSKEKERRLVWTIENYKVMMNRLDIPLILGLSVFSKSDILYVKKQLKMRLKQTPILLGLGGLVPLMRLSYNNPKYGKMIVNIIHQFHKAFPDAYIHVYGLGDCRWYPLIRLVGGTSSDYAGFYRISGKGEILLPTLSAKHILRLIKLQGKQNLIYYRRREKDIFSEKEMKILYGCKCPICKTLDPHLLEFHRTKRLIHNLFIVLKENERVDEYCAKNDFKGLKNNIRERARSKSYGMKNIAKYALKLTR